MTRKITTEIFIERAKKKHGNKYSYERVEYVTAKTPVEIFCKSCNKYFKQTPDNHMRQGCYWCGRKFTANQCRKTKEQFVKEAQAIHGDKYDYTDSDYINTSTKIKIFCKKCQKYFWQRPHTHIGSNKRGRQGCPLCGNIKKAKTQSLGTKEFILRAKEIYNDQYEYDQVNYVNNRVKVKIYCKKCQKYFFKDPNNFLHGSGCARCSPKSKGEQRIKDFLIKNSIDFEYQKRFEDCKDKFRLPFDFYLPNYNACIEYQGVQHYNPKMFIFLAKSETIGMQKFKKQKQHDEIKKEFCKRYGITLLEIKYTENIEKKLLKLLN